jgi:hypothetical protein
MTYCVDSRPERTGRFDEKKMRLPSGDQAPGPSKYPSPVNRPGAPPAAGITHRLARSSASRRENNSQRPSGDSATSSTVTPSPGEICVSLGVNGSCACAAGVARSKSESSAAAGRAALRSEALMGHLRANWGGSRR